MGDDQILILQQSCGKVGRRYTSAGFDPTGVEVQGAVFLRVSGWLSRKPPGSVDPDFLGRVAAREAAREYRRELRERLR